MEGTIKAADASETVSDWQAAQEFGIDVSLLEHNLTLTPTERIEQLHQMQLLYELLRPAHADSADP